MFKKFLVLVMLFSGLHAKGFTERNLFIKMETDVFYAVESRPIIILEESPINMLPPQKDFWSRSRQNLRTHWEKRENIFPNEFPKKYRRLKTLINFFKEKYAYCGNDEECLEKLFWDKTVYFPRLGIGRIIAVRPTLETLSYQYTYTVRFPGRERNVVMNFEFLPERIYIPASWCSGSRCLPLSAIYQHSSYGLGTIAAVNPYDGKLIFGPYANNEHFYSVSLRELVPTKLGCLKGEEFCVGQRIPHPTQNRTGIINSISPSTGKMEAHFRGGEILNIRPHDLPGEPLDYGELCEILSSMGASCLHNDFKEERRKAWVSRNRHLY